MSFPLRAIINERGNYFRGDDGFQQISFIVYQLFCGLKYLHDAGVTHGVRYLTTFKKNSPYGVFLAKNRGDSKF